MHGSIADRISGERLLRGRVTKMLLTGALAALLAGCGGGGAAGDGNPPLPPPPPANTAPTIGGAPATSTHAGSEYSFTPDAGDADGDRLTFEIGQAQSGDSEALALRNALLAVYDNRIFSRNFNISFAFPDPFGRTPSITRPSPGASSPRTPPTRSCSRRTTCTASPRPATS